MRKASSYDLIRARSLGSSGYSSGREPVEPAQQVGLDRRLVAADRQPGPGERQGVGRVDLEDDARVLGAEVVGVGGPHALVFERRAHRDELGEVVAERPEAVVDPRADRREAAVEQVPAGEELQLGAVVVVGRVHRPDHGEVVDALAARAATSR